jgi:hypothetical protein
MTALDKLRAARALISDPAKWTQGTIARDWTGKQTTADSIDAFCWCAIGALEKVASNAEPFKLLKWSMPSGYRSIVSFNDSHTHDEVLALFDKTIAKLVEPTQ